MPVTDKNSMYNSIYPIIEKPLTENTDKLRIYILRYINRNLNSLQINGPIKRLIFLESDKDILYEYCGIDKDFVKKVIKECPLIQSKWKILTDPFNILIAFCTVHYIKTKNPKMIDLTVTYLMLKFYSSIQYKYARYELNPNIMDYTINNLSNKYKIKQFHTIFDTLVDTSMVCFNTHKSRLTTCSDETVKNWIMALNTRIQGIIKKIISAYEINRKDGNFMNAEEDSTDEETFKETTNNSMIITRYTNALTSSTISRPVNEKLIKICSRECDIGFNELKSSLELIINSKTEEIKEVYNLILQLFLMEGKHKASEISSKLFIIETMAIYKKSNTKDESINRIKQILDLWLSETSVTYMKTQRVATKNNFRKGIFMYFVLFIYQFQE